MYVFLLVGNGRMGKNNRALHIDSSGCEMIFILLKWLLLIQLYDCITTIKCHHFIIHMCTVKSHCVQCTHMHFESSEIRAWLLWKQCFGCIYIFNRELSNQRNIGGSKTAFIRKLCNCGVFPGYKKIEDEMHNSISIDTI